MMHRPLLAVLLILLLGATAADAGTRAFSSSDDMLRWINGYRDHPEPNRLPEALHAMTRLGLLADQETAGVYVGFAAGVLATNQAKAQKLIARMFPLTAEEEVTLIRAVAFSGLPDWQDILVGLDRRMPKRQFLIERYISGAEKPLSELTVDTGRMLDTHWGFYMATGSYDPALKIIAALKWSGEKDDVDKLTVGSMAKWTLASNAAKDENLLSLCRSEIAQQPDEVAAPLRDIVEAAQTFEFASIRKDALAAIEEIKTKGSQSKRNWTWASQAGTTAVALGCVAASVTGHVELGLPCVVTGALTQAATKVFVPQ